MKRLDNKWKWNFLGILFFWANVVSSHLVPFSSTILLFNFWTFISPNGHTHGLKMKFYILIHYVRPFVWRGFWGVWEGEVGEAAGDWCESVMGLDHHGFRVQTISTKHCSCPKGRNDSWIASLSHHTRGRYKNLPSLPPPFPPTTERTDGYIEERVFKNFQNFREPRFKMSELRFWVFSHRVKE